MTSRNEPAGRASASHLTDEDVYLFREGSHFRLWEKLGSHPASEEGSSGTTFRVWAPNARRVSVVGMWNAWDGSRNPLSPRGTTGIWEGFVPDIGPGTIYRYRIDGPVPELRGDKADPFAVYAELPPRRGSIVWSLADAWDDDEWMAARGESQALDRPLSIYELHLGSWRRTLADGGRPMTYREIAEPLADHVERLGFTHVELLPLMEHPFYGSWGYQVTGYFAASSRYGTPEDLMYLVDHLHRRGIGVIFDWVPSHFPTDGHGLGFFDGTHLFEHADPRRGFHPDWSSFIFDYDRPEVVSFLVSSALFWVERFHADGLRVDAVASMLYLDFSRPEGEWVPNEHGGHENLGAVRFIQRLTDAVRERFPDVRLIAEESSVWPGVSRATWLGGLGFDLKWDMGWMNDTLAYFALDPLTRRYEHHLMTFRPMYAASERFVVALSHDEVVHGKGSLLSRMPGSDDDRRANLRLLLGYQWAVPGKKLLFMGAELGEWREWDHDRSLDWSLLDLPEHQGIERWVSDLNGLYRELPALHHADFDERGFEWIDCHDATQSVLSFLRRCEDPEEHEVALCVFNFTPVPRVEYRLGVPWPGRWRERLNSDRVEYGGRGFGNDDEVEAEAVEAHGRTWSVVLTLPPLGALFLVGPPRPLEEAKERGSSDPEAEAVEGAAEGSAKRRAPEAEPKGNEGAETESKG